MAHSLVQDGADGTKLPGESSPKDPLSGLSGRDLAVAAARELALPVLAWAACMAAAMLGDALGVRAGLSASLAAAGGGAAAASSSLSFAF